MTTDAGQSEESRWLRAPAAPGQIEIRVAVGENAAVTPELQEMLDRLLSMTRPDEVAGYAFGVPIVACGLVSCNPLGGCGPLYDGPCRILHVCAISPEI